MECNAQEYIYKNFGVDEGLPSSEVYDVFQDKEGYIWFATDKGLSRFNGYEFENFNTSDGLTGNVVLRFYPQQNGQIWCYSYHNKSLFYFDQEFKGFKPYKHNAILGEILEKSGIVKSIYLDPANNLHIGGFQINGELIISSEGLATSNFSSEDYFPAVRSHQRAVVLKNTLESGKNPFFFTAQNTDEIGEYISGTGDNYGRLIADWLESNKIAVFMNHAFVEIISRNKEKIILKTENSPIGMRVIDSTQFFVGYEFGGAKIVDNNGTVLKEFLKGKSVTNLLLDHEGGYWFSTLDSGVFYIKEPSLVVHNLISPESPHVRSLAKTNNNELLIGYNNGTIAKLLKNRTAILINDPIKSSQTFVQHDTLLNRTYFYHDSKLTIRESNKNILQSYLLKLSEPINGTLFGSSNGAFHIIKANEPVTMFKSSYRIHDVVIHHKDTLLSTPLGVFKFGQDTIVSLSNKSNLFDYRTEDMDVSDTNILFVATQGAGVIVDDGLSVYNLTQKDGLNSDIVKEIYIENDTTVWVCTNGGINRINLQEKGTTITGFNKKKGLLSNEIEDIEIIHDTVWVATKQGLCYFPKGLLIPKSLDSSYLQIKEVFISNKQKGITEPLVLTYKENEIELVLEGISFANMDNLEYQYRLNNDSNWSSTKNRTIQFSSLSPGHYVFEAKMCNGDQNCSEKTVTYEFTIQAPFWKKGWFALLCFIVFCLLVYLFFRIRVLTYNKDITRELIRLLVKRLKRKEKYFSFRENGNEIRIKTYDILYIKSAGNYIDIHTENKTYIVRMNIGKFLDHVPDKLEYIRVHRSYIVRIDKITSKSKNDIVLIDTIKIPVSQSHQKQLKDIHF